MNLLPTRRRRVDDALRDALLPYRRGCSHEQDIAAEVESAVRRVLDEFGLIGTPEPEAKIDLRTCWYCHRVNHAQWCVEVLP